MKRTRAGLLFGIGAYFFWGLFPFYFGLIEMVGPFEVVPWRVATTLLFCALLVTASRRWSAVLGILRSPRVFAWFALSGLLLYTNWQLFIIGVMTDRVLETSLGYFINPFILIIIGVVLRGERLSRLQWVAVAIAGVGVLVAAIGYGAFPWIALGLALSFGFYGVTHKQAGETVDGITGLAVETLATLPVAVVQFVLVASLVGVSAFSFGAGVGVLVLLSGVITAIPLILFGESVRRLPLSYMGFLQFLTPILTFVYGALLLREPMPVSRWIGFIAVWIAVVTLVADMIAQLRRSPTAEPAPSTVPLD